MQFNLRELQLTANCSQHAVLIPFAASENKNNIVYVDAFPAERFHHFCVILNKIHSVPTQYLSVL